VRSTRRRRSSTRRPRSSGGRRARSSSERGDLDEPALEAIERYVRSDQLEREAIAERAGALTARGSTDQLVAHPLIAVERAARGDADDYARELLLTPRSQKASADKDDPGGNSGSGLDGAFG
jgi:hypothetical protein